MDTFSMFNGLVFLIHLFLKLYCCTALDFMTPAQPISDGQILVSSGQSFELGFFSPSTSKNRYVGIWYKTTPDVVVWVANRNNPLTDSSGQFTITNNGSLLLLNRTGSIIWSSNTSFMETTKNPVAQLLESGNPVVGSRDSLNSKIYAWQSFDYPSDNLLAGMKLGWELKTGLERYVTWKSSNDPSVGDFTYRLNITGIPQTIMAQGSTRKILSGLWNGVEFRGLVVL
ncbi:S-locus-specific glycoprotein S13-like [Ziziphus jujuba]|uniref:S-locus-specific glycoprotein S13-like n=1 Tax=Ziziphus jujuba TaxID=326968 RepID=A0ABM3I913_ZIZJJ|nr:S-locus-specific glycoprotein S13-like [Ziziphus jujuba]